MFTTEQIKAAHGKVKSGADFPAYIKEIKSLGVTRYQTFVTDGHTDYHGAGGHTAKVAAKYASLAIADTVNTEEFKKELSAHQQGKSDFPSFIKMCSVVGVAKWEVCLDKMTCKYFDKSGNEILAEQIPG